MIDREFLTIAEAARLYGIDPDTVSSVGAQGGHTARAYRPVSPDSLIGFRKGFKKGDLK